MVEILNNINENLIGIKNFLDYVLHPSRIFIALWNWTFAMSFWICLFIALFSLISYMAGIKKYAKLMPFSVTIYALIQAIGSVF